MTESLRVEDDAGSPAGEPAVLLHDHAADHGGPVAARWVARFSKRTFSEVQDLPTIADLSQPVTEVVKALGFAKSNGDVRRVAEQNGLRLVVESEGNQEQVTLSADETREPLAAVVKDKLDGQTGDFYLKVGRKLARIRTMTKSVVR